jgi:RNA polymerase sigma-70 factor (ECF subfamily)
MDDDGLIAAVAGGDDGALRELFSRHAPWLAVRLRAVLPAADVEDVLQESFLAVWRGARGYRPEGAAGGWLWGIARRQAAQWLRHRGRAVSLIQALEQAGPPAAEDPAQTAITRADWPMPSRRLARQEYRNVTYGGWSTSRTGRSPRWLSCSAFRSAR